VVNASLAAAALLISIRIVESPDFIQHLQRPFDAGLLFVSACLLLTLFVYVRNHIQGLLTRVIFLRSTVEDALQELQQLARATQTEVEHGWHAAAVIAKFVRATRFDLTEETPLMGGDLATPVAVREAGKWRLPAWVHAAVPCVFPGATPDTCCLDHAMVAGVT
jgi:hypothetical protein